MCRDRSLISPVRFKIQVTKGGILKVGIDLNVLLPNFSCKFLEDGKKNFKP